MWLRRILNMLFGWRYVAFDFGCSSEIRIIRVDASGREYAICYGQIIDETTQRMWRVLI
jgi:hypothetical protein